MPDFQSFISFAAMGLAACGVGYYCLVLWAAVRFVLAGKRATLPRSGAPPVSVLKPLYGLDPQGYQSLQSYCEQDYPRFEILFGVADAQDPSVSLVQRLLPEFPEVPGRLIVCPEKRGANLKVSSVVQMLPHARYPHLLISDSDIRARSGYLRQVMSSFDDPTVGLVTCLYRGIYGTTLGSKLEALAIATGFAGGVLAAREIEKGIHFGLGSTLAFSREALQKIGGLEPLLDFLADDFELGSRISKAGKRVVLSHAVVDHFLPDYTFSEFVRHQLRWARSTRDSRPAGYFGLLLTFVLPWSCLAAVLTGGAAGWGILTAGVAVRLAGALVLCTAVLGDHRLLSQFWLIPIGDVLGVLIWAGGYTGRTVEWRGRKFILNGGRIRAVAGTDR